MTPAGLKPSRRDCNVAPSNGNRAPVQRSARALLWTGSAGGFQEVTNGSYQTRAARQFYR